MSAINSINSPAREKIRSAYDQILQMGKEKGIQEGMEKGAIQATFQTFRNGKLMGFSLVDLIALTGVSHDTAQSWYALLSENPDAELPTG